MATPIKMFRDSEEKIATLDIVDGQLMFATDSKNIYLDDKNTRIEYNKAGTDVYVTDTEPKANNGDVWYCIESVKIVDFSTGTDEEIKKMLDAHYAGEINIEEYWHVGDTRKIHIDATNSDSKEHVAQDMTMVIMDFNHDDLTTPINGKTKAAVSVGFREIMGNNGTSENEYYWESSHYPVNDNENYSANPLRTWLNGGLLNALPNTFSSIIKEVNKKNLAQHTSTSGAPLITKDKIWLLSYPEIFRTQSYSYYKGNPTVEGEQYQYFATSSNRIKYLNKNGEKGNAYYYWLRSPSSRYDSGIGYSWCNVNSDGSAYNLAGNYGSGLALAFCL